MVSVSQLLEDYMQKKPHYFISVIKKYLFNSHYVADTEKTIAHEGVLVNVRAVNTSGLVLSKKVFHPALRPKTAFVACVLLTYEISRATLALGV